MFVSMVVLVLFALEVAAIYFAWRAIVSARTPQGAVGWTIFLLAAPYVGVPLYLFLGHHRYRGYEISRRKSARVIRGIEQFAESHPPSAPPRVSPEPFERISDLPTVGQNSVRILIDGEATFDAIFAAIDAADRYVLVQFFIVHDDEIGRALQERLVAAAGRGVVVRFMVDPIGSHGLPSSYLSALRRAGVDVAAPRQASGPRHRFEINFRNHRKTVVVDGQVGFTGGHNVGDEYLGRSAKFGPWRDTHVELRGPLVAQLQLIFSEDWHWATGRNLLEELDWAPDRQEEDLAALIVPTGPGDEMDTGTLFFFSAIAAAQERVWIASPYCVPDLEVLAALKHAALGGKDVRLILPEAVDHWLPWFAAFAYFDELRRAGVRILRYREGFMHQKVVLVDDAFAAIGTANLDNRSFRLNFEMMVAVFDEGFAGRVEAFLVEDMRRCEEVSRQLAEMPLRIRVGSPLARLFAPLL